MATFILIHGAWHGGWCWEHVAPLLTAEGHQVLAPDLPGMGADTTAFGSNPLSQWADFVADLASRAEAPVILVGHSRGGLVISEVAERVPDRIDTLVYLTAFLLEQGQSLVDVAGRYPEVGLGAVIRPAADPSCLEIDCEPALPIFYGRTSEALARAAATRLTPEPAAALTAPVKISAERFGRVARVYIEATDDLVISLEMQREMHAALPCERVIALDSDHSPFYSMPSELAQALLSLV